MLKNWHVCQHILSAIPVSHSCTKTGPHTPVFEQEEHDSDTRYDEINLNKHGKYIANLEQKDCCSVYLIIEIYFVKYSASVDIL